jgi:hypothetical protein
MEKKKLPAAFSFPPHNHAAGVRAFASYVQPVLGESCVSRGKRGAGSLWSRYTLGTAGPRHVLHDNGPACFGS